MSCVNVTVSINDDQLGHIDRVAAAAKACGLEIHQVLETLGIVSGSIDEASLDRLRAVQGVSAVEREQEYQLSPPDSYLQ
ncbi:MAG: ketohydroxyglutarate aldolase [Alphaproteobacteria bacterium]